MNDELQSHERDAEEEPLIDDIYVREELRVFNRGCWTLAIAACAFFGAALIAVMRHEQTGVTFRVGGIFTVVSIVARARYWQLKRMPLIRQIAYFEARRRYRNEMAERRLKPYRDRENRK